MDSLLERILVINFVLTYTIFLESRYTLGMFSTAKAGTVNVDVGDEFIEASLGEDKEFKTGGIQVMSGVTFPISKLD